MEAKDCVRCGDDIGFKFNMCEECEIREEENAA